MAQTFDPDAAAAPGSGMFGLPFSRQQARIVLLAAPYDATTSYRPGTADGPDAILRASHQVDLHDGRYGPIYEQGIFYDERSPVAAEIRALSDQAAALARPIINRGGATHDDRGTVDRIDATADRVRLLIREHTTAVLREGKIPGLLGGEHAVSLGSIEAVASAGEIGILQVDAHMDLRDAFEGFRWSHASIMFNVLREVPKVTALVQVGLRDFGASEIELARSQPGRVHPHFDDDWKDQIAAGGLLADLCRKAIEPLPGRVYISFDIDGLDPCLCPHTGTPVPGGFTFHEATTLLHVLRESGREVAGFDLVEVAPGPNADEPEWDANVGARLLYKLCGVAAAR